MTFNLKLNSKHSKFLFNHSGQFNPFNLVRLLKSNLDSEECSINISNLSQYQQGLFVDKFKTLLLLVQGLESSNLRLFTIAFSAVDNAIIEKVEKETGALKDEQSLIFDCNDMPEQPASSLDPHAVKNIRGAVLLSLVLDLLELQKVEGDLALFNETSKLTLHSACSFLHNQENAKMMWEILERWDELHSGDLRASINRKIQICLQKRKELTTTWSSVKRSMSQSTPVMSLYKDLHESFGLSSDAFESSENLQIWFVDDQHADGWYQLVDSMLADIDADIRCFNSQADVEMSLKMFQMHGEGKLPELAIVDLRLSEHESAFENYDSDDLSGFAVVDSLLKAVPGLPIVIASASNKLWNLEKAIKKGAMAYWRKSDEYSEKTNAHAVSTAMDIYCQFIEKMTNGLRQVRYCRVFAIARVLDEICQKKPFIGTPFQRRVRNFFVETQHSVTWMLWQDIDEKTVNDRIFLGTMELFNEIEKFLWDDTTERLTLYSFKRVKKDTKGRYTKIIDDTLECIDSQFDSYLLSKYESCKSVRNKLPIIHGSEGYGDVKHAEITNIETSLLMILTLTEKVLQFGREQ